MVLYRRHGGYYYRSVVCVMCLAICAFYGVIASLLLPLINRADLINYSVSQFYYNLLGFLVDISVTIEGAENLQYPKSVLVCNHQSSMDIFFMASVFPKATSVVAKKALKYYPFLGWFMTLSNAIFLDRKNRDNAIKEARQAAEDIHNKNISVWLFPEGTRGHASKIDLLPFKKGAFYMAVQAGVPIVPIVVENYYHLYDSKSKRFNSGKVRVRVLPPVPTKDIAEDSASVDKLATHVREDMIKTLKELASSSSLSAKDE
ncbi:hypothetical protein BDB00DRAFT_760191 [Zychaea mexicana]|uniref:uncharacterized protein n=1 Tax=Zychaea mexicana TaxID=64656 RepID=UPI0022FDC244|nr:uncharacterized protein BDB00DRAFT_760191 [Zychaea mexicana]KAI9495413.1 hypothetical protein BDB00DRAFT_760191 [Zychaea mexicana]